MLIDEFAQKLKACKKVLLITGAGCSADCGIPTYRGVNGLYNGTTEDGMKIEDALHISTLLQQPEVSWKYIKELLKAANCNTPHAGYYAINNIKKHFKEFNIFTQNIDGLHEKAGTPAYEMHGNAKKLICLSCGTNIKTPLLEKINTPHLCSCGGIMKPSIILFGEALPVDEMSKLNSLLNKDVDAVIAIGTSAAFHYIKWPFILAGRNGWLKAEINIAKTPISQSMDFRLEQPASDGLVALKEALERV